MHSMNVCFCGFKLITVSKKTTPLSSSANIRIADFIKFCVIKVSAMTIVIEHLESGTYPDFVPDVIVGFEHAQMMLDRDDQAMSLNEILIDGTR
jgi:hypothetical protein